jgi:hypothetical protein
MAARIEHGDAERPEFQLGRLGERAGDDVVCCSKSKFRHKKRSPFAKAWRNDWVQ